MWFGGIVIRAVDLSSNVAGSTPCCTALTQRLGPAVVTSCCFHEGCY